MSIQIDEIIHKEYRIKVYTITGELVYENVMLNPESTFQLSLPTGIYVVTLTSENIFINKKLEKPEFLRDSVVVEEQGLEPPEQRESLQSPHLVV